MINPVKGIITEYLVIVEQAVCTLSDLLNIWTSPDKANAKREWFTPEKLAFYFF